MFKFKPIKAEKPKDLKEFIGKELTMMCGTRVVVVTIVGSIVHPTRYEVNGRYFIVILDAYKQLNRDKSITQEMIDQFDKMILEKIEKMPAKPTLIDQVKTPKYPDPSPAGGTDGKA